MRFRPEQHVRRQCDFRDAREKGRRYDCGGFALWCYKRPTPEAASQPARVGVIASTSAVGIAVLRSRAKRRLREVFRKHQALVPPGHDLLMVARHSVNRLDFSVLENRFVDTCKKAFAAK